MKHSHMVKSKKSTKSLHPIVQPGDCVVSGLLYSQVIVLWVVSCTAWWLCCEWSLVQCTAWWLCCVWSLVQPSDCVVSSHVYSLVIVCCIWSLVQPGDCIVCGHLYSLVIVCCVRSVSFTQPQDRNQSAKNTQRVQSSKNRKKRNNVVLF